MIELFIMLATPTFFTFLILFAKPPKCKQCKQPRGGCICLPF